MVAAKRAAMGLKGEGDEGCCLGDESQQRCFHTSSSLKSHTGSRDSELHLVGSGRKRSLSSHECAEPEEGRGRQPERAGRGEGEGRMHFFKSSGGSDNK